MNNNDLAASTWMVSVRSSVQIAGHTVLTTAHLMIGGRGACGVGEGSDTDVWIATIFAPVAGMFNIVIGSVQVQRKVPARVVHRMLESEAGRATQRALRYRRVAAPVAADRPGRGRHRFAPVALRPRGTPEPDQSRPAASSADRWPARSTPDEDLTPSLSGGKRCRPHGYERPSVFVSYAWDTDDHKLAVKRLSDLLHAAGVTVEVDQKQQDIRRDWDRWMTTAVLRSDYIVVVASPAYRAAGRYEHDDRTHANVQAEYALLMSLIYESRTIWVRKILPVVLPGREVSEIPAGFQPYDASHYVVTGLTADGIADLLRTIYRGRRRPGG